METDSEQQQQFVKWLQDEIKNVTFITDEGIVAFAKDLLKQKAKGTSRNEILGVVKYLIESGQSITLDEKGDNIIQTIGEKICDHLLDSEQRQQLTVEEQNFVEWLRDEIKNVTFNTDEGINAFAKDLLDGRTEGDNRSVIVTSINLLFRRGTRAGTITIAAPPDGKKDDIIQAIAEKIADHLLPDSVTAMETDSEQQQQQLLTVEEHNFVEWLRDEIKNVTFNTDEGINAFAKDMLDMRDRGKSRDAITGAIENMITHRNHNIQMKAPPEGNIDEIKDTVAKRIGDHLLRSISSVSTERFVSVAFQIAGKENTLKHLRDYDAFSEHLRSVYDKYYPDKEKGVPGGGYIAPYFPFVQSSGMGKTKLLYHFVQNNPMLCEGESIKVVATSSGLSPQPPFWESKLILCAAKSPSNTDNENEVFNEFFDFKLLSSKIYNMTYDEAYKTVKIELDSYVTKFVADVPRNIVLLFDEASNLLLPKITLRDKMAQPYEVECLLFRLVRTWLAEKRPKISEKLVGVFAGTNSSLRNYRSLDTQPIARISEVSREARLGYKFFPRGEDLFDEFCALTTLGCLRDEKTVVADQSESAPAQSEYWNAIPYGRPLFAKMRSEGQLISEKIPEIVARMLVIDGNDWIGSLASSMDKHDCWMSIIGTRVQMGQTSISLASSLVAKAYGNLVGVGKDTARISFGPDPVCARIAMCLMDEDWTTAIPTTTSALLTVKGCTKKWWVEKACDLFSKGLALPEKGDFGEVMVALYLLFCADEERKVLNAKGPTDHHLWYQSFSVGLDRLVDRLLCGGAAAAAATRASATRASATRASAATTTRASSAGASAAGGFFFNAIQVCRNYLRGYDRSWKELGSQVFLKHLFQAGVGFYTFAGCKTIDMVFPLKCLSNEGQPDTYYPMVVSVKSRAKFSPKEVRTALAAMAEKAKLAKWRTGLCLLVVLGPEVSPSTSKKQLLSSSVVQEMQNVKNSKVPCKVLYMPRNDKFGLAKAFDAVISVDEMPEILASHSFATFHEKPREPNFLQKCFRARPENRTNDKGYLLMKALMPSPEPKNTQNDEGPSRKRQGTPSPDTKPRKKQKTRQN